MRGKKSKQKTESEAQGGWNIDVNLIKTVSRYSGKIQFGSLHNLD